MVTYEEFVMNGLMKIKYQQLGGSMHDISTDESDMYAKMKVQEDMDVKRNYGVISILVG